ncbi:hypothetical protein CI610_03221 [invertebrate metagenome]|uniref:Uncharacterized protein n=1 Tax=invertebrate metagenome TaxID=1711999 RepID=A0A2H9T3N8_9ZZZZ
MLSTLYNGLSHSQISVLGKYIPELKGRPGQLVTKFEGLVSLTIINQYVRNFQNTLTVLSILKEHLHNKHLNV